MANNISFRTISFNDQIASVTIVIITDVACHLFCRLTTEEPRIHLKSVNRRGTPFMSELRFCYVSYEDNEQLEPGDTFIHTWIKPDWPFCVTKWSYFWGFVSGKVSPSTSPFFKHHNSLKCPCPSMDQILLETWDTDPQHYPPPMWLLFYEWWEEEYIDFYIIIYEPWDVTG